jgi:ribose transport system ATP-binding protein
MQANEVILRAQGVSMSFPGQKALASVDFDVRVGEVHALIGENGSGKSTLIRILAGYYVPDDGSSVVVGDVPLPFGNPKASFDRGLRF